MAVLISASSFAQAKSQLLTEEDIRTMLCQKWEYVEFQTDGPKLPPPAKWIGAFLLFNSDGTYTRREEGEDYTGKWSYDHKKLTLKIEDSKLKERWRIKKLTDTELLIHSSADPANFNIKMQRAG